MLSLRCSLSVQQKQTLKLTHVQRLEVVNRILEIRLNLVSQFVGEKYEAAANCPNCRHALTLSETLKGYNSDPTDIQTTCPKCKTRFEAKLRSGPVELRWFCPTQAQYELKGREKMTPAELLKWNPSVYHSLLTHFGNITNAFAKMDVVYMHPEEKTAWQSKVLPFLGQLPDTIIAEVVGVSRSIIGALRKSFGIDAFKRSKLAEEFS